MNILTGYSPLIERALRTVLRLHEGRFRKTDPSVSAVSHLFHTALIVCAHGFPEHVIAAALLHDTLEDTEYPAERLASEFGPEILSIVKAVSERKDLPWKERKRTYLESVSRASYEAKAVSAADKIHNLSTILEAHAERGEEIWNVFAGSREGTIDFYTDAYHAIAEGWDHPLVCEYRSILERAKGTFGRGDERKLSPP
ncbi:MAG: HD domain-containing protein [Bacteroidota bacterium]|nr:HD domain-containing protein [Bacteroidota bacterium]